MLTGVRKLFGFYTSPAEKKAREHFRSNHPGLRIAWSSLAAEEGSRFVVGVFYGDTLPPRYKFYEVLKDTMTANPLEDDTAYAPKVWR